MAGRGKLLQNIFSQKPSDSGVGTGTEQTTVQSSIRRNFGEPPTETRRRTETPDISPDEGIPDSGSAVSATTSSSSPRARGRLSQLKAAILQVEQTPTVEKSYEGDCGVTHSVAVNYLKLITDPNKGVFEYEVRFDPPVVDKRMCFAMLKEQVDLKGNDNTFDGVTLLLPMKLSDDVIQRESTGRDGTKYEIKIIFKRQKQMKDCLQLFGILFARIANILKLVRYRRKNFDPSKSILVPHHKLEIWPGHILTVDEYKGGVFLQLDVSFKVLHKKTVYELIREMYTAARDNEDVQDKFNKVIIGQVISTNYNNKSYQIHDVLWKESPSDTFDTTKGGKVTYLDYYMNAYGIDIKDKRQPLLLNYSTRRVSGKRTEEEIKTCLIPELCHLTGLTASMRNDFKVMKELATYTRVTPSQRIAALKTYIQSVKESPEASAALSSWGLQIDDEILNLSARVVEEAAIQFKNNTINVAETADFNNQVGSNEVLDAVDINDWILMWPKRESTIANKFLQTVQRCARPIGIRINEPRHIELPDDSIYQYVKNLKENITPQHKIAVIIVPTKRDDRYTAIKRVCCTEYPIPSQVINAKTLSDDKKIRNIVVKIILQMNCKIGGSLWGIKIPMKGTMIIGVDTYHDKDKKDCSVAGFVASTDATFGKWYSRAVIQKKKEELMNGLNQSLVLAIKKYCSLNGSPPSRIIYYRDGVGDGQLAFLQNYEIPQIKKAWAAEFHNYEPEFVFVVVQKRINTRIIMLNRQGEYSNALPGTVIDHTITRKNMYDFFLVPQSVRQGTATPTHYVVLSDSSQLKVNVIQRLAYKLCYLYYNWPGAIRVPAPCQYAHKLAFLVGQHIKKNVCETLDDKLFYL